MSICLAHFPEGVPWGERSAISSDSFVFRSNAPGDFHVNRKDASLSYYVPIRREMPTFTLVSILRLVKHCYEDQLVRKCFVFFVFWFQGHKQSLQGFLLVLSSMCHRKRLSTDPRNAASQQKAGVIVQRVSLK